MLTRHSEDLYSVHQHHTMFGLHLGARMSVVRLAGGGLLVYSPIALTPELKSAVDALGAVQHIVAPNLYHHVYARPWGEAWPEATVHAARALRQKRPDLPIARDLEDPLHPDLAKTLVAVKIEGCLLEETVLVHERSRTVISADLTENFTRCDHWPTRLYLKASGVYQRTGWSRLLRFLYRDHQAARRSVDRLLEHDVDRLVIAHGDVIETGARDAIRQTFTFLKG